MAMRNLVEGGDCGGSNALVRTADHFNPTASSSRHLELVRPQAHGPLGHHGLEGEAAFRMDALLQNIQPVQPVEQIPRPMPLLDGRGKLWVNEYSKSHRDLVQLPPLQPIAQVNNQRPLMRPLFAPAVSFLGPNQRFFHPPSMSMSLYQPNQEFSQTEHQLPQPFLQQEEDRLKQEEQNQTTQKANEFVQLMDEIGSAGTLSSSEKTQEESEPQEKDDLAFWNGLAKEWEGIAQESDAYSFLGDYDSVVTEPFSDGYYFKDDNPLKDVPNAFQEGIKKLNEGDIPSAVLLFEAAVQQEPSRAEAWEFLGTTQAKNEQDPSAIRALKRAKELDPNNLTVLMALAVSFTNESYQRQACDCLAQWILSNPAYSSIAMEAGLTADLSTKSRDGQMEHPMIVSSIVSGKVFQQIKEAYIRAARVAPSSNLDPDVQSGLGVLLNLSGEYDKAVDCFRAALSVRPDDALLWNRLGATLANGNRSEEAISAYSRALTISPGFLRSRFNLGISCINLNSYREAVEHFLFVLNLQNQGRGLDGNPTSGSTRRTAMSNNVWTSMRMVLSLLNRQDLYEAVETRDLNRLNKEFNMTEFMGHGLVMEERRKL